jgi:hypothetical protein
VGKPIDVAGAVTPRRLIASAQRDTAAAAATLTEQIERLTSSGEHGTGVE